MSNTIIASPELAGRYVIESMATYTTPKRLKTAMRQIGYYFHKTKKTRCMCLVAISDGLVTVGEWQQIKGAISFKYWETPEDITEYLNKNKFRMATNAEINEIFQILK